MSPCKRTCSVSQAGPLPACDPSLPRVAPAACFHPQGNPADGAYACMRRPQSPGPCVVWLYVHVCGLPGPLLICPKPANGLPSDHGCLLYFCLHQLNSDHPLPPAGPNQAPAPPPHSPWRGPGSLGPDLSLSPGGLGHLQTHLHVATLPFSRLLFLSAG